MSVHESLTVPYHQQDTDYYCGAACGQMVLASIGAGLISQDDIYTDERNHTVELSSWFNPPDGLQWVMNDRRPAGFSGWFAFYSLGSEDAASRKLVWTLHHYKVAPIAMVYGGDHWLVVRGFEASAAPASSGDTAYTITAFEVNNPWPPVPGGSPPPPHGASDGCGSGGNRGVANEHIAYGTWQSTYMTANKYGTLWYGKYNAVCDPDPPPERPGRVAPRVARRSGEEILAAREAVELAQAGLRAHQLDQRKGFREAFAGTRPGEPILVQRLDQMDSYYYIVPFGTERAVTSAVAVDARFGDYRQSIALPEGGTGILVAAERKAVLERLSGRRIELPEPLGHIKMRSEAFCLYPTMVWRPSRQSLSPFYPFHMITVGEHRIYVRIDGEIFTRLDIHIPGI